MPEECQRPADSIEPVPDPRHTPSPRLRRAMVFHLRFEIVFGALVLAAVLGAWIYHLTDSMTLALAAAAICVIGGVTLTRFMDRHGGPRPSRSRPIGRRNP